MEIQEVFEASKPAPNARPASRAEPTAAPPAPVKPESKVALPPKPKPKAAPPAPKAPARSTKKRVIKDEDEDEYNDDDDDIEMAEIIPVKRPSRAKPAAATASVKSAPAPKKTPAPKKAATPKPTLPAPPPGTKSAEAILATIPDAVLPDVDETKKFSFRDFVKGGDASAEPMSDDIEIPIARDNCLAGLKILFTGVLPHLSRDQCTSIVKRYGGEVMASISGRTSIVVIGAEAGPSKIKKIKALKTKTIDEDGFLQLLRDMPAAGGSGELAQKAMLKKAEEERKIEAAAEKLNKELDERYKENSKGKQIAKSGPTPTQKPVVSPQDELWTTKYAPRDTSEIIGNPGAVRKLQSWLEGWKRNHKSGFKKPGPDGSGIYRAVMLHGPPGIGKTTAAHLIANLAGYDVLENNASDTRSKLQLAERVSSMLSNKSITGYFGTASDPQAHKKKRNIVLIMDEVDGMSAGDRGGVGQMAALCKTTDIPIILVCNERSLPKMRPFDRVTFDVPFRRPDANAARVRLMSIARQEKLALEPAVIDQLVTSTHADIRQIINILSMYSRTRNSINSSESVTVSKACEKDTILKPFDIIARFLAGSTFSPNSKMTLQDKIELYFNDHDMTPLMVQENYLSTIPSSAGNDRVKQLDAVVQASASISDGDLVDARIHSSEQQWSLMPLHAVLSTVRPASFVAGQGRGRYNFTSYLGNNSKRNKYERLLQEIHSHARLCISGDRREVRQDYLPLLTMMLLKPLMTKGAEGVDDVIQVMDGYYLTKEDWDIIMELGVGDNKPEEYIKKIPTAVKSGFTRKYNASSHPVPFMRSAGSLKVVASAAAVVPDLEETIGEELPESQTNGDEENADEDVTDLSKDKYIKVGKAKATRKAPAKKAPAKKTPAKKAAAGSSKAASSRKK